MMNHLPEASFMHEDFLHYIWQFQQFDKADLRVVSGEEIQIFSVGHLNRHAGPDFSGAKIQIGNLTWSGQVEIHLKSSLWQAHKHQQDEAYESVILHVVWEHDSPVFRKDGTELPVLALKGRVSLHLIDSYRYLQESQEAIPCHLQWEKVNGLTKAAMIEKALIQRLERKGQKVSEIHASANNNWEETAFRWLCLCFGLKINTAPAERLARSIPYKVLLHHSDQLFQLEALLFGQAGLLPENSSEEYVARLSKEYGFLKHKFRLEPMVAPQEWKFFRLRPANFPTLRLAQLAAVLHKSNRIFSKVMEAETEGDLKALFQIEVSSYWKNHFRFGKESSSVSGKIGKGFQQTLWLNFLPPLLFAYARHKQDPIFQDKALEWLEKLNPEKNSIVEKWENLNFLPQSAFESQGQIELFQEFCTFKRCLDCAIGNAIIRRAKADQKS